MKNESNENMINSEIHAGKNVMKEDSVSLFNKVLRGEISAVEAYKQVIEKFKDDSQLSIIKSICSEHISTVDKLKKHIVDKADYDSPDDKSGVWGVFVSTFIGTAKALGDTATLKALNEGEEHGLNQYVQMLESDLLTQEDKNLIKNEFIPVQKKHIQNLKSIVKN